MKVDRGPWHFIRQVKGKRMPLTPARSGRVGRRNRYFTFPGYSEKVEEILSNPNLLDAHPYKEYPPGTLVCSTCCTPFRESRGSKNQKQTTHTCRMCSELDEGLRGEILREHAVKVGLEKGELPQLSYWTCRSCGHDWFGDVTARRLGRGCPSCLSLKTALPFVAKDHSTDNPVPASRLFVDFREPQQWKCSRCSHKTRSTIMERFRAGCPQCPPSNAPAFAISDVTKRYLNTQGVLHTLERKYQEAKLGRVELSDVRAVLEEVDADRTELSSCDDVDANVVWKCSRCEHTWEEPPLERVQRYVRRDRGDKSGECALDCPNVEVLRENESTFLGYHKIFHEAEDEDEAEDE
eukprot:Hpha_TRINITY_DN35272_c0_g1::TRINITY_DN35272_c0_g1_i1::g.145153::m.145153